jgi:hypothetical protein
LTKVYIFDTEKSQWEIPKLSEGSFVLNKSGISSVITAKMRLFGDFLYDKYDSNYYVDDMLILDIINYS